MAGYKIAWSSSPFPHLLKRGHLEAKEAQGVELLACLLCLIL